MKIYTIDSFYGVITQQVVLCACCAQRARNEGHLIGAGLPIIRETACDDCGEVESPKE